MKISKVLLILISLAAQPSYSSAMRIKPILQATAALIAVRYSSSIKPSDVANVRDIIIEGFKNKFHTERKDQNQQPPYQRFPSILSVSQVTEEMHALAQQRADALPVHAGEKILYGEDLVPEYYATRHFAPNKGPYTEKTLTYIPTLHAIRDVHSPKLKNEIDRHISHANMVLLENCSSALQPPITLNQNVCSKITDMHFALESISKHNKPWRGWEPPLNQLVKKVRGSLSNLELCAVYISETLTNELMLNPKLSSYSDQTLAEGISAIPMPIIHTIVSTQLGEKLPYHDIPVSHYVAAGMKIMENNPDIFKARDENALNCTVNALEQNKHVVMIAGANHYATQAPVLRQLLGDSQIVGNWAQGKPSR